LFKNVNKKVSSQDFIPLLKQVGAMCKEARVRETREIRE